MQSPAPSKLVLYSLFYFLSSENYSQNNEHEIDFFTKWHYGWARKFLRSSTFSFFSMCHCNFELALSQTSSHARTQFSSCGEAIAIVFDKFCICTSPSPMLSGATIIGRAPCVGDFTRNSVIEASRRADLCCA